VDAGSFEDEPLKVPERALLPHRGEHRIAEGCLLRHRRKPGEPAIAESHERMRHDQIRAVQDEGIGAEVGFEIGDELRQLPSRHERREHADELFVQHDWQAMAHERLPVLLAPNELAPPGRRGKACGIDNLSEIVVTFNGGEQRRCLGIPPFGSGQAVVGVDI
jgi:hypothetical protein